MLEAVAGHAEPGGRDGASTLGAGATSLIEPMAPDRWLLGPPWSGESDRMASPGGAEGPR